MMLLTQPRPNRRMLANDAPQPSPAIRAANRFVASAHDSTGKSATTQATTRGTNSR
jgi:hypothetical protein